MKIIRADLENFRNFFKDEKIEFAEKGVTLVTGENTVGKSSLLNAITWCLYGKIKLTKKGVETEIINFQAKKRGVKKAEVKVYFIHMNRLYSVRRIYSLGGKLEGKVFMESKLNKPGETFETEDHWSTMNSILPEEIYEYFFFSGETKSEIDANSGGETVSDAIHEILGMRSAKLALTYLENNKKKITKKRIEMGDLDEGTASLFEDIEDLTKERDKLKNNITKINDTIKDLISERTIAVKALGDNKDKDVKKIAKNIKLEEKKLEDLKGFRDELVSRKIDIFREYSWTVMGNNFFKKTETLIEKAIDEKHIPADWKKELVELSLNADKDGNCKCQLCKTSFKEGSKEFKALTKAISEAVSTSAEQRAFSCNKKIGEILTTSRNFTRTHKSFSDEEDFNEQAISDTEKAIDRKKKSIKSLDIPEVTKLQERIEEIDNERDKLQRKIGALQFEDDDKKADLDRKTKEYNRRASSGAGGIVNALSTKEEFLSEAIEQGKSLIEKAEQESKVRIREIMANVMNKCFLYTYEVAIDKSYKVSVHYGKGHEEEGRELDPSGAENKFINIAFVIALALHSRERIDEESSFFVRGSEAPLLIDAPYGELGTNYIRGVTAGLIELTDQLALFVKPDHMEAIRERIKKDIKKEYVLNGFVTVNEDDLDEDLITSVKIQKKSYSTITPGADFQHAEIVEVRNG